MKDFPYALGAIPVVELKKFLTLEVGAKVLVDLGTVHPISATDYERRNENVKANRQLCSECGGTGNWFFPSLFTTFYRACPHCTGTGTKTEHEETKETK